MSCRSDSERKELQILLIYDPAIKVPIPIPIPDITPLNPPLGVIPPIPKKIRWLHATARLSAVQAALIGLAKAAKTSHAVSATGSLDVLRYRRVLKALDAVGLGGW